MLTNTNRTMQFNLEKTVLPRIQCERARVCSNYHRDPGWWRSDCWPAGRSSDCRCPSRCRDSCRKSPLRSCETRHCQHIFIIGKAQGLICQKQQQTWPWSCSGCGGCSAISRRRSFSMPLLGLPSSAWASAACCYSTAGGRNEDKGYDLKSIDSACKQQQEEVTWPLAARPWVPSVWVCSPLISVADSLP